MEWEDVLLLAAVGVAAYVAYKSIKPFVPQGKVLYNPTTDASSGKYELLGKTYTAQPTPAWYWSSGSNFLNALNPFSSLNPGNIAAKNLWTWLK